MKNQHQGFIPVVAAILIGALVVAGGITIVVLKQNKEKEIISTDINPVKTKIEESVSKELEQQQAMTPPTITAKQVTAKEPEPETEKVAPPVAVKNPAVALIDTFLSNPTLESLKTFCAKAKNTEGFSNIEAMNKNRTAYETRKKTLYEEAGTSCSRIDEEYNWTTYRDSYLLPLTDSTEPDKVREVKLKYNKTISSTKQYSLFGYTRDDGDLNTPPNKVVDEASLVYVAKLSLFNARIVIPEQKLKEIKEKLLSIR